jgi:hypothetical protein
MKYIPDEVYARAVEMLLDGECDHLDDAAATLTTWDNHRWHQFIYDHCGDLETGPSQNELDLRAHGPCEPIYHLP